MGYLVPVRGGPQALSDWESPWEAAVAVAVAGVTWKFRLILWPGTRFGVFKLEFGI